MRIISSYEIDNSQIDKHRRALRRTRKNATEIMKLGNRNNSISCSENEPGMNERKRNYCPIRNK